MSKLATAASLSTGPQQEKIIQDIEECVKLLVEIFQESRTPINDDNQTLQRFCAKLEHLFQMDMKEKYSLLGRRKDYWDYFCDCLSSNKGSNDGIKFVKSLGGEHKTSLGKGRALIRFCLVHNRLPDSIQQCVINGKVTSDYFFPQSIWLRKEKSSAIISCLYDLSEVNFDLSSRGYDLDSAWPSFAKKSGGSFSWNPPSRRSSISSMASVQTTDNTSVLNMSIPAFDSHEVDRLNQDLAYSESLQSELKGKVESLQEEKFLSDKSAWVTQGELMAVQNQLQDSQEQLVKLQEDYRNLEKRNDQQSNDKSQQEKDWKSKIKLLEDDKQKLEIEKDRMEQDIKRLQDSLSVINTKLTDAVDLHRKEILQLETSKADVTLELKSCQNDVVLKKELFNKKVEELTILENKLHSVENHNQELLKKLEGVLEEKGADASISLDAAGKLSDMLNTLQQTQTENTDIKGKNAQLEVQLSNLEEKYSDLSNIKNSLDVSLEKSAQEKTLIVKSHDDKMAVVSKELSESQNKVDKLTLDLQQKESDLLTAQNKYDRALNDIIGCFSDTSDLSRFHPSDVDFNAQELFKTLKSSKDKLVQEQKRYQMDISSLTQALDSSKSDSKTLRQNLDETRKKLKDLNSKHEDLKVGKNKLKDELKSVKSKMLSKIEETKNSLQHSEEAVAEYKEALKEQEEAISHMMAAFHLKILDDEQMDTLLGLKKISEHTKTLTSKVTDLQSQNELLNNQLQLRETGESEMENKLSELMKDFSSKETKFNNEVKEKDNEIHTLSKSVSDLQESVSNKNEEIAILVKDCDKLNHELEELKEKFNALSVEKHELENSIQVNQEKLQQESSQKADVQKTQKNLEEKIKICNSDLESKNKTIELLQVDLSELKSRSEVIQKEKEEVEKEKHLLETESATVNQKLNEMSVKLEQERTRSSELQTDRKDIDSKHTELKKQLDDLNKLNLDLQSKCDQYENERDTLNTRLDDALHDTQSIKDQLSQTSVELEAAYSSKERVEKEYLELQDAMEKKLQEFESLKEKHEVLEKEFENKRLLEEEFGKDKVLLKDEIDGLKNSLCEAETNNKTLTEASFSLTSRMELMTNQFENQSQNLDSLQIQNKELESELSELKLNLESVSESKLSLEEQCADWSKKCADLERTIEEKSKSGNDRETELKNLNEELKTQIETQNQEISALQFQLSSEQLQHEEMIQSFSNQQTDQSDHKKQIIEYEKHMEELQQQLDSYKCNEKEGIISQESQIEMIKLELLKKGEELNLAQQKIAMTEEQLNQERVDRFQLKGELDALSRTVSNSSTEKDEIINTLKSDNKQLKKKLIKLIRDKDALWQMTDQLTYEQKQQAEDVWMDNNTVTNCLGCNAEFSLWLRRHHCRLCGKIYCHNCCNNWVKTAHSSKKERVCNRCKSRHELLEQNSMNSSVLSSHLDSDEENDLIDSVAINPDSASSYEPSTPGSQDDECSPIRTGIVEDEAESKEESPPHIQEVEASTVENTDLPKDDNFHLITNEEISRSLSIGQDDSMSASICDDPSMCRSVLLLADELERGEVNNQNETTIKPGKIYVIPVKIDNINTTLYWQFTSKPKDIVFSVKYSENEMTSITNSEVLVEPCKCNSHQKAVEGELTAKEPGIYSLVFDNTYSKLTSKTIHYVLKCTNS